MTIRKTEYISTEQFDKVLSSIVTVMESYKESHTKLLAVNQVLAKKIDTLQERVVALERFKMLIEDDLENSDITYVN